MKLIDYIFSKNIRFSIQLQSIRYLRMRKPPWEPRSKSKQYRIPPLHIESFEEKQHMVSIWQNYKTQLKSIYLLFGTEGKFSNKESLVVQELKNVEIQREIESMKKNDYINNELLKIQLTDNEKEILKLKEDSKLKYNKKLAKESLYQKIAENHVIKLKEKCTLFVDSKNLEDEINKMLNEKHDYSFSIDSRGNFYKDKKIVKLLSSNNNNNDHSSIQSE